MNESIQEWYFNERVNDEVCTFGMLEIKSMAFGKSTITSSFHPSDIIHQPIANICMFVHKCE